jgi:large subunit ribosomal protein L13
VKKTPFPSGPAIKRDWFIIDASDVVLGRLATEASRRLAGKHKAIYTPFLDTGDHIIVVNAEKVRLTGGKDGKKLYHHYSGYPGGMSSKLAGKIRQEKPERMIEEAIWGMLPKGPLGRQMYRKLKVYRGPAHRHSAQQPKPLAIVA